MSVSETGTLPVTVVSWNMNHWRQSAENRLAAWSYLANDLGADVALVQEAGPPPKSWQHVGTEMGGSRDWGTRVVSPSHPLTEVTEVKHLRVRSIQPYQSWRIGTAATATTFVNGLHLTLVSLYGLMEPRNAYESINRHLADVGPLLDSPAHLRQTIIGGDLNLTTQWTGTNAAYAPIDRALLDQFRAYGLRDLVAESADSRLEGCPCTEGVACRHRQTLWQSNETIPRQNDYLFASKRLRGRISLSVDRRPVELKLSDHAPLIAVIHP